MHPLFSRHQGDLHSQFFNLTDIAATTATLTAQDIPQIEFPWLDFVNFVNGVPILPQQREYYHITLRNTVDIFIGFCTIAGLGVLKNYERPESAYYWGHGAVRYGGVRIDPFPASVVGDIIECEADLRIGMFRWRRNGSLLTQFMLPEVMRGKAIYLSIIMRHNNNQAFLSG
jgi:hypothetical protein